MKTGHADIVIDARNLTRRFGALTAVDNLGLQVRQGEIFGLVGPDGAGKTTVMRMLAGVMRSDAGTIMIDGIDVRLAPERARRHLSYMPQRFGLYDDLTVDENIRFFADLFEVETALWRTRADAMLSISGMLPFRCRRAGTLSGGMKQKLGLTCSLVHAPRVLLLDEPTTGVDPVSRREFWQILYGLREEGVAILISTAYLDEAERCDRLALMNAGAVLMSDTPAGLKARMPGVMYEIVSPHPHAVRDVARTLPGIFDAQVVGMATHVHADDDPGRPAQIAGALRAAGIEMTGLSPARPSIEDLFIAFPCAPQRGDSSGGGTS